MVKATASGIKVDSSSPDYYFNRELSWLEFNDRVLHEAMDKRTPLLEQLKFLAIFSSNLDEYFMVRVSGLMEQVQADVSQLTPDGLTPQEELDKIQKHLRPKVAEQHRWFKTELRPKLAQHGIHLLDYAELTEHQQLYLHTFFEDRLFPVLTPLGVDPAHPFPRMSNLSLNLALAIQDPETSEIRFARVKVPNSLPRFVAFPEHLRYCNGEPCGWAGVPLEQVIAHNLEPLFPGMVIQAHHLFRITRDADFPVKEDEADDLMLAIQQEINKRRFKGFVVRLEIQSSMPDLLRDELMRELNVSADEIYEIDGLLDLKDLLSFLALPLSELKDPPWNPVVPPRLKAIFEVQKDTNGAISTAGYDIFSVIRQGDLLVHHPYESFVASVQEFVDQAADDPQVLAIKMTLYRTSGDALVNALIRAAENGKQVAAVVELKARFDEANNISWAQQLEDSGVHVVYGVVGLKTHTKTLLVVREEGDRIRRYVHIGTGNYNPKTATLYTDLGLLSCRDDLGADLTDLFNFLTGFSRQQSFRKLWVAPVTLRDRTMALIHREIEHHQRGQLGRMIIKVNSLVDPCMIQALYEASQIGVQIDIIVRGICCLRPGIEGVSDNIRVISIIGRYLEHSRIFYFHNDGHEEIYIGSADWMPRNFERRVEVVTPIEDPKLIQNLKDILDIMLSDNRQAWDLHSDGTYVQRRPGEGEEAHSTHQILMERARILNQPSVIQSSKKLSAN
jgi:polyphosphate kinase